MSVAAKRFTRRRFLTAACLAAPLLALGEATALEPQWVRLRSVKLGRPNPTHRIVHFTDLHYKGDRHHLESVVRQINSLNSDVVCFTGDLMEDGQFLPETLEVLAGVKAPMYGVPGNHEYWSHVPFDGINKCFASTGGAWLLDEAVTTADGRINIIGATCLHSAPPPPPLEASRPTLLLAHYPAYVKKLGARTYDLILAGHSHGGQVRLPFYGALGVPFGVDQYDLGLFQTPAGPLYVNPGIGWFYCPIRFLCRPEITVFEV